MVINDYQHDGEHSRELSPKNNAEVLFARNFLRVPQFLADQLLTVQF